jgi:hypothetical protein
MALLSLHCLLARQTESAGDVRRGWLVARLCTCLLVVTSVYCSASEPGGPGPDGGGGDGGTVDGSVGAAPVAVPGPDVAVPVFQEVRLDGTGSYAAPGEVLVGFAWVLDSRPAGTDGGLASRAEIRDRDRPVAFIHR